MAEGYDLIRIERSEDFVRLREACKQIVENAAFNPPGKLLHQGALGRPGRSLVLAASGVRHNVGWHFQVRAHVAD